MPRECRAVCCRVWRVRNHYGYFAWCWAGEGCFENENEEGDGDQEGGEKDKE